MHPEHVVTYMFFECVAVVSFEVYDISMGGICITK